MTPGVNYIDQEYLAVLKERKADYFDADALVHIERKKLEEGAVYNETLSDYSIRDAIRMVKNTWDEAGLNTLLAQSPYLFPDHHAEMTKEIKRQLEAIEKQKSGKNNRSLVPSYR